MTRVVFLSPALPLPFGRADARWLHAALSGLSAAGVDVRCLSCTEERPERVDEAAEVATSAGYRLRHVALHLDEPILRRKVRSVARPRSELARCAALVDALAEERPGDDGILHVEHLFSAWVTRRAPRAVTYLHHLEVVDWSDRRRLPLRERIDSVQMRRATRTLLRADRPLIVASDRLASEVQRYRLPRPPVVPVAVDPTLYPLVAVLDRPVVGVIGSMHWYPSRAAAERVLGLWPAIRARVPDATLLVAGWNSDRYLSRFFPLEGAELLGPVDRPEDFFARISVLLYPPPRGSGMKIKVLEALAYGVPVVSNTEGLEGLCFEHGRHAIRAESDDDIVRETSALLHDGVRRRSLRDAGRALIEREHSPSRVAEQLLVAYDALGLLK